MARIDKINEEVKRELANIIREYMPLHISNRLSHLQ